MCWFFKGNSLKIFRHLLALLRRNILYFRNYRISNSQTEQLLHQAYLLFFLY